MQFDWAPWLNVGGKLILAIIPILLGLTRFVYNKLKSNDFNFSMDLTTIILFYILPCYLIVLTVYLKVYEEISNIDNNFNKDLYTKIYFVISVITLGIALIHLKNFILLKNKFYIYKEVNENKYKFIIKGYNNLKKDYIEVSTQDYYINHEGFNICNKYKSIEEKYLENQMLLYNKQDKYIELFSVERKSIFKTWFKINGRLWSIFGLLPILFFLVFIIFLYLVENEYYIIFSLIAISLYTMFLQAKITNNINKKNQSFKTEYIAKKNQTYDIKGN